MNIHQILNFVNVISSDSNTNVEIRGGGFIKFNSVLELDKYFNIRHRNADGIESKDTGFNPVAKLQRFCRDETSMPLRDFSQDSAQTVSWRISRSVSSLEKEIR